MNNNKRRGEYRVLKAEYVRRINKSSLIITTEKDCGNERDSIEMFRYNDIPYFLKMEAQRKDIHLQFYYDITSKRSLEQLLEYRPLDYQMLQIILNSLDQACMQTEDFMMTENDILLEPEFIFADHNMESMCYCYIPGNGKDICMQFKGFMEYLLQHMDHKDEQAVQLAYGVYQRSVEERTALHNVLKDEKQIKDLYQTEVYGTIPARKESDIDRNVRNRQITGNEEHLTNMQGVKNKEYTLNVQDIKNKEHTLNVQDVKNEEHFLNVQDVKNKEHFLNIQDMKNEEYFLNRKDMKNEEQALSSQDKENEKQMIEKDERIVRLPDNEQSSFHNVQKYQSIAEVKKTKHIQENVGSQKTDQVTKIQEKATRRKQAAEKLKNMLRKKIYTDRARYTEDDTVFEGDEEEIICSNPTVCLVPDTDGIQNQFVYQGADRSRDFHCMRGKMLIGSDKEESDIYIPIPMISRVHARIEIDAQGAFLEDMNSTNGTHVNGELLQYREKRMLQKGDIISLAGECYSFH